MSAYEDSDVDRALLDLARALQLAEPENIVYPFVVHADVARDLLRRMTAGAGDFALPGFRRRLLVELGDTARPVPPHEAGGQPPVLLSEREHSVLRLLRGPLRNGEIAANLDISPTLKTHVRNIYRKLGADDREQARSRAKTLGL